VARQEFRIALGEWLTRFPRYSIKPGTTVEHHLSAVKGVTEMHLELP
jgi:hypothetical protein